jgi:hypothetical protein
MTMVYNCEDDSWEVKNTMTPGVTRVAIGFIKRKLYALSGHDDYTYGYIEHYNVENEIWSAAYSLRDPQK